MSSARSVPQPPSTPWGRENAVSAAHHGSPERRRLPEASLVPKASFLLQTALPPPPPLASAVRWRPSCSPTALTHGHRQLALQRRASSVDFAVYR